MFIYILCMYVCDYDQKQIIYGLCVSRNFFVISRIASPFSRQIAIGNADPATALESMGAKRYFRCHFLNIALIYKQ